MTGRPPTESHPAVFVSADWSKDTTKRSVHVADLAQRRIWRETSDRWCLGGLLELARRMTGRGSVLVGLDLALGVPGGYWDRVAELPRWRGVRSFPSWLRTLDPSSEFFQTVKDPAAWQVDRPFFHVPGATGGLRAFQARVPGGLLRRIDRLTGAKPLFAVSGIPGTVGSGTRAMWKELIPELESDRDFAVWPFEGELEALLASRRIVLAETYPGLAYAAALAEELPTHRLIVGKTRSAARELACDLLASAPWVRSGDTDLGDLEPARADEDAFDSHLAAAALLRCTLEGWPLCGRSWIDARAEGAMLLAGPVHPGRRARRLRVGGGGRGTALRAARLVTPGPTHPGADVATNPRDHRCPIPGCTRVFRGSRGGWDAHIASFRMHPDWYPQVTEPAERKRLFRAEYGSWFR